MECYICTDITDELSPCNCKMPVHAMCLNRWVQENRDTTCSICKSTLENIFLNSRIEIPTESVNTQRKSVCLFLLGWLIYKILLALCIDYTLMGDSAYWNPLDVTGCIIALVFGSIMDHFCIMCRPCHYLRYRHSVYYEFNNNTSDNGDDQSGDIV